MPEGDTIRKLARVLGERLIGRALVRAELPRGEWPRRDRGGSLAASVRAGTPILAGHRVVDVRSKGKHLLVEVEGDLVLRTHLGMKGSWHHFPRGADWGRPRHAASLVLETAEECLVCFAAREVELQRAGGFALGDRMRRLGPDLADGDAPPGEVRRRLAAFLTGDPPLVDVLLDQRIVSGIGNVYKSEVLFLERTHPSTPLHTAGVEALLRILDHAGRLLRRNLDGGPRVTRFVADGRGVLWVYGREGRPCFRCGEKILRQDLGVHLRSTSWCPRCQAVPSAGPPPSQPSSSSA